MRFMLSLTKSTLLAKIRIRFLWHDSCSVSFSLESLVLYLLCIGLPPMTHTDDPARAVAAARMMITQLIQEREELKQYEKMLDGVHSHLFLY